MQQRPVQAQPKADGIACGSCDEQRVQRRRYVLGWRVRGNLVRRRYPCGSSNDSVCDNPDTCDGDGNCQTNHEPTTSRVPRATPGAATSPRSCDANGNCPADAHEPAGTTCGDPTDTVCDDPDSCDANGVCQPNYVSSCSVCRQAAGECDVAELCDGAGGCPMNTSSPGDSVRER
jgi:hypothetical protein